MLQFFMHDNVWQSLFFSLLICRTPTFLQPCMTTGGGGRRRWGNRTGKGMIRTSPPWAAVVIELLVHLPCHDYSIFLHFCLERPHLSRRVSVQLMDPRASSQVMYVFMCCVYTWREGHGELVLLFDAGILVCIYLYIRIYVSIYCVSCR